MLLVVSRSCVKGESRVFFFSSRRRHTRYIGDWSSDVCSSDLGQHLQAQERVRPGAAQPRQRPVDGDDLLHDLAVGRSEERRVGKECSSRWAPPCTRETRPHPNDERDLCSNWTPLLLSPVASLC